MNKFMKAAYQQAQKAYELGEVPVGAVIVKDQKIIARAYNTREKNQDFLGHAEINVMKKAAKKLKTWRLEDCEIYVTLEPCCMCAGSMIQARIKAVYYAAVDQKGGCCESLTNLFDINVNHKVKYISTPDNKCAKILTQFFQNLR